jgi:hypothetical protein
MKEIYQIHHDLYWWREDWEAVNKIDIGKTSLKEQAGIIKKIVVWLTEPKTQGENKKEHQYV